MSSPDQARRAALEERLRHARRDLEELEGQIEDGEIDAGAGGELAARYRSDIQAVEEELAALPPAPRSGGTARTPPRGAPASADAAGEGRPPRRIILIAGVVLVAITVGIVIIARSGGDAPATAADPQSAATLPAEEGDALAQMEAAVAAQPDNNAMRLALADLYFQGGDFMSAMNHYSTILSTTPTAEETAVANARIGWMSYAGLDEPAMAVEFLEAAVEADPEYGEAKLFLGVVLLYGMEDPAAALPILEEVTTLPDFPEELRPEVEQMIEDSRAGAGGE